MSLAGNYDSHDGWFHNLNPANGFGPRVGNSQRYTIRGAVLIEPTANLKITLSADGSHGDDASPILIQPINGYQGFVPGGLQVYGPYDFIGNEHVRYVTGQYGGSGRVVWDLGGVSLTSTTAMRHYLSRSFVYDSDTTPSRFVAISNRDVGENFTQEVLLSSTGQGAFTWVVGGFYLRQDGKLDPLQIFTGAGGTRHYRAADHRCLCRLCRRHAEARRFRVHRRYPLQQRNQDDQRSAAMARRS